MDSEEVSVFIAHCGHKRAKRKFCDRKLSDSRFHRGNPLTRREVQFWLPIASDVSVSPYFACGREKCVEVRDPFVRKINREIFRQSSAIAGRSEKLIASLSGAPIRKAGECYSN